jgi:cell division protein FtsQ
VGRVLLLLAIFTLLGGCAASAYLLKSYLDRDARFRIGGAGNIEASGLTEVSRAEMLPVFGEDIGRNIFFVPLTERRKQLEQLPWVERATVMRLLPDQIRVSIVERQPVAFALQPNGLTGLVDADGVLLSMPAAMMAQRHYSFPVVTGINTSDPLKARRARMAVYLRLLSELDSGGQKISTQISDVDLTDPEDVRIRMQDDPILLRIGQDHFLERYQRYKANIAGWRQLHPDLAAVDLRYEQQVVLSMPADANVAQAAAAASQSVPDADSAMPGDAPQAEAVAKPAVQMAGTRPVSASKALGDTPKIKGRAIKKSTKSGEKNATRKKKALKVARIKAMQRKRATLKRTALRSGKQPSTSTNHPAASAGMAQ